MKKLSIFLLVMIAIFIGGKEKALAFTCCHSTSQSSCGSCMGGVYDFISSLNFVVIGNQPFKVGDTITYDFTARVSYPNMKYMAVTFGLGKGNCSVLGGFGFNSDSHDPTQETFGPVINGIYHVTRQYTIPNIPDIDDYTVAFAYPSYFEENPCHDPNDWMCWWSGWNQCTYNVPVVINTCSCDRSHDYIRAYRGQTSVCVSSKNSCGSSCSCDSTCKKIIVGGTCSGDIFVPLKTWAEWNSFINNHPGCVSTPGCQ